MATGWLLGDAVGRPLFSREQAHAVGLKARKLAVAIKADLALTLVAELLEWEEDSVYLASVRHLVTAVRERNVRLCKFF